MLLQFKSQVNTFAYCFVQLRHCPPPTILESPEGACQKFPLTPPLKVTF